MAEAMNVAHLLTTDCTITAYSQVNATVDQYGDPIPQAATSTTTCWLQQDRRDDITGQDDLQAERWTVWFPAGTSIDGHATVTVGSTVYTVKGPPWSATNPRTGQAEYVVATLVRTT